MQLEKDSKAYNGINLLHYKNPETGINDVTMIVFDLRLFQQEMANMSPTLSDAITQLGINQVPQPSVAQSLPKKMPMVLSIRMFCHRQSKVYLHNPQYEVKRYDIW